MLKPRNYDEVLSYGEFNPLPPGGYICRIMNVKETLSKTNKDMIEISLDIAEGEYADYYRKRYKETPDTRNKKWGCIVYQRVLDNEGNANRGLKTFHTAVEKSNNGFSVIWGNDYGKAFKGKLIGCLFRREEYENSYTGKRGWLTKCFAFRSIAAIKEGRFEPPKDKPLQLNKQDNSIYYSSEQDNINEDDLPF